MSEPHVSLLRGHAKLAPWNARGLAAHATALAEAADMRPTNAAARAALSARGVRFYVANGLLDRPEGRGTAATYGYRHLLQLLAIKIRQREGQTLDVIKRELAQVTGDSLERRVAQALAPALGSAAAVGASAGMVEHEQGEALWRHIVIAPGVELLLRHGTVPGTEGNSEAVRQTVRAALGYDD
jgi:DNA-binding transcriptional MerR regulator